MFSMLHPVFSAGLLTLSTDVPRPMLGIIHPCESKKDPMLKNSILHLYMSLK